MLSTLSCNKERVAPPLDPDEILRQEIAAKLDQDAYPMNLLSTEAKVQLLKGLVIEDAEIMSFGNESLMRKSLTEQERVLLYEVILDRGVILYGENKSVIAKSPLAEIAASSNGMDPIGLNSDYQWFGTATQCCKCYWSTCLGSIKNCQCP